MFAFCMSVCMIKFLWFKHVKFCFEKSLAAHMWLHKHSLARLNRQCRVYLLHGAGAGADLQGPSRDSTRP